MSELGKVDSYDELRPANIYDVAANETWLEDQSAQGWHLTGFSGWSGLFALSLIHISEPTRPY